MKRGVVPHKPVQDARHRASDRRMGGPVPARTCSASMLQMDLIPHHGVGDPGSVAAGVDRSRCRGPGGLPQFLEGLLVGLALRNGLGPAPILLHGFQLTVDLAAVAARDRGDALSALQGTDRALTSH